MTSIQPQLAKLPTTVRKPDTLGIRIKKRRRLFTVAAVLVVLAISDFLVMRGASEVQPALIRGWRLFLYVLLALYLARGSSSARWATAILSGITALAGVVAVTLLTITDILGPNFRYLLVWFGVLTVAHGIIAAFLWSSTGVTREVRRSEHVSEEK